MYNNSKQEGFLPLGTERSVEIEPLQNNYASVDRFQNRKDYEFVFLLDGAGTLYIGGQKFALSAHSLFFIPKNIPHKLIAKGDCYGYLIHFSQDFFREFFLDEKNILLNLFSILVFSQKYRLDMTTRNRQLELALQSYSLYQYEFEESFQRTKAAEALILILDAWSSELKISQSNSKNIFIMNDILKYIDSNLKTVTITDLTNRFYMGENYLYKLFKKFIGQGPKAYITQKKLEKAYLLLNTTQKSTRTIYEEVGFNDYFSFDRAFKKYYGKLPVEMRE